MNEKKATFNVLYIIKKSKLLKNGEAPICMRITTRGQIAEIMIKRSIAAQRWNQAKECSNGKSHVDKELNHYLETTKARIYQIQREMEIDGQVVTANAIRDRYNGKGESVKSLLAVYQEHNDKCRALIGIDYTESTVQKFDASRNRLQEFIQHQYRKKDVLLSEVNSQFISEFEFYLKTVRECQQNTVVKQLKNLKKVIRIALANEWIKKDPFFGIKFKHEETHVEFLTHEELQILIQKVFAIPRLEQVRDIFVFCAFTGLAFVDVQQLTPEHIVKDNNGALWIRKPRQKTGNMCNIPLLSAAQKIIEKYKEHPHCIRGGVLLPVISNQKYNAYLKEIADIVGINKRLTSHVARHTAATVVFLANNVSLENVAKILGHSNTTMTQHYAKVLDSSIMRDMANVENRFAGI